jgi:hypothetical protein
MAVRVAETFRQMVEGTHPLQNPNRDDPGWLFTARVIDARQHGYSLLTALQLAFAAAAPPPPPPPSLWNGANLLPAPTLPHYMAPTPVLPAPFAYMPPAQPQPRKPGVLYQPD